MKNYVVVFVFFVLLSFSCSGVKDKMVKLCSSGDVLACEWVKKDKLCDEGKGGNPEACSWLKGKKDCSDGNLEQCFNFALKLYNEGNGLLAKDYFIKALKDKDQALLKDFIDRNKTKLKLKDELYFYDLGCELKNVDHCADLGALYRKDSFIKDAERSTHYYKKACELGKGYACYGVASALKKQGGANEELSLKYNIKACELNFNESCGGLALDYFNKVVHNFIELKPYKSINKKAIEFFNKYNKPDADTHHYLGISYALETDSEEYKNKALEHLGKACKESNNKNYCKFHNAFKNEVKNKDKIQKLMLSERTWISLKWEKANEYCETLEEGGFTNWRLPSISELRELITSCKFTEISGECGVKDKCLSSDCMNEACTSCLESEDISYSKIGNSSRMWSSSKKTDANDKAWIVNFGNASILDAEINSRAYVRCIR